MSYPAEIKSAARAELAKRRERSLSQTEQNRAKVFAKIPQAAALEREISAAAAMVARTILSGGENINEKIKKIRDVNLEGQKKLSSLLTANGFCENALDDVHVCPICKDSGVSPDGMVCKCVKELERSLMFERLAKSSNFSGKDFDSFSLGVFDASSRPVMEKVYNFCIDYAESFSPSSPSLLMIGSPGLGKTHLSLAVGFKVLEKGVNVVYEPFHSLFSKIENARFGRSDEDLAEVMKEPLECELLILDDLGSEMPSSVSAAALYEIINTRLLKGLPTIISTNLTDREMIDRYKERVYSRLFGAYKKLPFIGEDYRLKK
ncbi:MAG: ATP-binding protein [Oscillospiraceae bacterium]|nr:ATP-binding protein [Oscillospiraceae bacterium]